MYYSILVSFHFFCKSTKSAHSTKSAKYMRFVSTDLTKGLLYKNFNQIGNGLEFIFVCGFL